jgi:hypothetical protein
VRKELQLQLTTKLANSTIGKANNFQGTQRSRAMLFHGCAFGWKTAHCFLLGPPRPSQGSRAAVSVVSSACSGVCDSVVGTCWIDGSVFSAMVKSCFSLDERELFSTSSGWTRCHFVSGNMKTTMVKDSPISATLSHQKLRQPT